MDPNEPSQTLDFRDIVWRVRRYRWLVVLPIVAVLCGALVYLKVAVPRYESAVLVALGERPPVSPALEPLVRQERVQENPREKIALLDNRVHSRRFLSALVDRLGLAKDPVLLLKAQAAARHWPGVTPGEFASRVAIIELSKKIRIVPVEGNYIRIVASDPDAQRARSLASVIADQLIEENKRVSIERVQARGQFSAEQMTVYEERLRTSEDALRAYQESIIRSRLTTNPVSEGNVETAQLLLRQVDEEIAQVRDRLDSANQEYRRDAGPGGPAPELKTSRSADLERRLAELEVSLGIATLRGEVGRSEVAGLSPRIAGVRQGLLSEYEERAAALPSRVPESARSVAAGIALDRSILRSLREKRQRVASMVQSYAGRAVNTPRQDMELQRLRADVDNNRDYLSTLRKESASTRITEALEISPLGLRLDIVEPPQLPLAPTWPKAPLVLGGALLMGPMLALLLLFGLERFGATLGSLDQAEAELGVKVIGTIPRIEGWSRPGTFVQRNWAPLSIVLVLLLTGTFFVLEATVFQGRIPGSPVSGAKP